MQTEFKRNLPQEVMALLPLTLFFPVGLMYFGLLCFFIAFIVSAEFEAKVGKHKATSDVSSCIGFNASLYPLFFV